ncbi:hypothetical protein [Phenylobacterium sp.]|uniref:hypothetical protein n=1 Tax=Phenylobacterium sp. TaxID=1871053 RepID=UPI002736C71E|nr:hypothetical protein [Phenylobacterium sp.]MDP3852616.1 hypothetical protein [Phenylobacterium sp.]
MILDDETLMAFADGELDAEASREVADAIAHDPVLRARVERFRAVRALVSDAATAHAPPVPPGLLDAARRHVDRTQAGRWTLPTALAAGIAGLALGLGVMTAQTGPALVDVKAGMAARGALKAALDATPSGESKAGGGLAVSPQYTLRAADGRTCRGFRVTGRASVLEGAACREDDGWRLLVLAPAVAAPKGGFATAASPEPVAVQAAVDALGAGDPLGREAERALIEAGWPISPSSRE